MKTQIMYIEHKVDGGTGPGRFVGVRHLIFAMLVICGCTDTSSVETRPDPSPEDYVIHDDGDSATRIAAKTFEYYDGFSRAVEEAEKMELYEGLPHYTWESELLRKELKENETIAFDHYSFQPRFYAAPVSMLPDDADSLKQLYCERKSFVPFRGYKMCGGFHADWGIKWKRGDVEYQVLICFGCQEMMTSDDKQELYCDIWDQAKFEQILNAYRENRPPSQ